MSSNGRPIYTARLRFYGELNDFLPPRKRQRTITYRFTDFPSVKDTIEAIGPPHPEVALIVANSHAVDFAYQLQPGDYISVYPAFRHLDVSGLTTVQPPAPHAFIADVHLGRLVAYMRMLGFDTLLPDDHHDELIAEISHVEERVLLTRDIGLLKRGIVTFGYFIRETHPWRQLEEVIKRYDLEAAINQFKRCTQCNHLLHIVEKTAIVDLLPAKTTEYYDEFHQCGHCEKIYWRGSHYEDLDRFLARLRIGSR